MRSMSVEDKLNKLKSILSRIRYVRYGDYVYAEDHNLKVEALKLIHSILEDLKVLAVPFPVFVLYFPEVIRLLQTSEIKYEIISPLTQVVNGSISSETHHPLQIIASATIDLTVRKSVALTQDGETAVSVT